MGTELDSIAIFAGLSAIPMIDHTSLNDDDTEKAIESLVDVALSAPLPCGALIVYKQFVPFIKQKLTAKYPQLNEFKVGTVVNFPGGQDSLETVMQDAKQAAVDGVDEIDVVIDYKKILSDKEAGLEDAAKLVSSLKTFCVTFGKQGKAASGPSTVEPIILKVIMETGMLSDVTLIETVSSTVLDAGADFLKTSTGKVAVNATLEAANAMMTAISKFIQKHPEKKGTIGFKAAGGVRNLNQLSQYVVLAQKLLGGDFALKNMRFGTSSLLKSLLPPA